MYRSFTFNEKAANNYSCDHYYSNYSSITITIRLDLFGNHIPYKQMAYAHTFTGDESAF